MVVRTINSLLRGECTACMLMGLIVLASGAYWIADRYVETYILNDLVDGPLMAVSFTAGGYYLSWSLFNCRKIVDRAFMLRFGICLSWIGNGIWRVSRFLYAQGVLKGPIGAHDAWRGYMIVLMTIAGVLHILAIDMETGRPTGKKTIVASLAVVGGALFMVWAHARSSG
jgi:hypothetical protein